VITYYNLGQCVGNRMLYFRSTDVEQMNYRRLLWSVPDELLYFLSVNESITIVEKTSNSRGGKIERIFIPVLIDILKSIFFQENPESLYLKDHYSKAMDLLKHDKQLLTKYKFWKNKIKKIDIQVNSILVAKEPNILRSLDKQDNFNHESGKE